MADFAIGDLSAAERGAIGGLKRQVTGFAEKFSVIKTTASDLAPKVMKLFNELAAKYDTLGGFVGFARLFDTGMATHAADKDGVSGYRNNKTYQALDYMRRTLRLTNRPRGQQGRRDPATDQLARTLATVMQVVRGADAAVVWAAVATEFDLKERAIARLKTRVEQVKPIIDLTGVRQVPVNAGRVIHMNRADFREVEAPQARRPGRPRRQVAA